MLSFQSQGISQVSVPFIGFCVADIGDALKVPFVPRSSATPSFNEDLVIAYLELSVRFEGAL